MRNLISGPSTDPFPFGDTFTPKSLRGKVVYKASACTACRFCEQCCVGGAIRFDKTPEGLRFLLWHNSCTFCGLCEFYCPTDALTMSDDWHLAHAQDQKFDMVERGVIPNGKCAECGAPMLMTAPNPNAFDHTPSQEEIDHLQHLCPKCRRKVSKGGKS
jgi:formate hydrogenlyase subunit 6/NADH:ubiquinone oxidoreductase subunit I